MFLFLNIVLLVFLMSQVVVILLYNIVVYTYDKIVSIFQLIDYDIREKKKEMRTEN